MELHILLQTILVSDRLGKIKHTYMNPLDSSIFRQNDYLSYVLVIHWQQTNQIMVLFLILDVEDAHDILYHT